MIDVGSRLSHFRISAKLGEGGMGVVWRAVDERLGREVAIKVLPEELARSPQRRMRFEREASAIAALNHPNIVTIYSLEEDAGLHFIAMELVSGKNLVDLIPGGGFPLPSFLNLASQIVDAIGAAHARGITHRDIKPGNIMLDNEGRVKVLDFGLAKLVETVSGDDLTEGMDDKTALGQVLGTLAYMSPEQAEGRAVDHRSDVFSLGVLLYEMATGRHPFKRDNNVSTLSAILTATPVPVVTINDSLPVELGAVITRCLARSPEDRYPSAAELRQDLATLHARMTGGPSVATMPAGAMNLLSRRFCWCSRCPWLPPGTSTAGPGSGGRGRMRCRRSSACWTPLQGPGISADGTPSSSDAKRNAGSRATPCSTDCASATRDP